MMDKRRWGPGERPVFEPYTKEVCEELVDWVSVHNISPEEAMGIGRYEQATLSFQN